MPKRTVWQSTKTVLSSTTDIVVTTAEVTSNVVKISGEIFKSNLDTMRIATIRDNAVENLEDAKDAFNTVQLSMQNTRAIMAEADDFTKNLLNMFLEAETSLLKEIAKSAKI